MSCLRIVQPLSLPRLPWPKGALFALLLVLLMPALTAQAQSTNSYISIATSASPLAIGEGASAAGTITITPNNGYTGSVLISVSGLPKGVTAAFTPLYKGNQTNYAGDGYLTGGGGTATLTLTVSNGIPAGSFPLTVTAALPSINSSRPGPSVAKVLTLNITPVFQIIGINNGDTISGDSSVGVNAYTERGLLTFSVDGNNIGSSNLIRIPGQSKANFSLETSAYPNGTHVLTVSDVYGNIDTRTVTFSNALSNVNYNPMFDSTAGVTDIANACHITGTFSTPQAWTVNITDDSNNPIKAFSGNGSTVDVTWNGTNANSQVVPGDDYLVTITGSGTTLQAASGTGANPQGASATSKTFLVNKDNYADSIILLRSDAIGAGTATPGVPGGGGDSDATHRAKAIAYKHFLHAELDRFVGGDFHYPILVSIVSDYDFLHDPKLVGRIANKFRRPALLVYVVSDGNYLDPRDGPDPENGGIDYIQAYRVHPWFVMGPYYFYSGFSPDQMTTANDIDVSSLTPSAGYSNSGNGPLVWMDTCLSTAGGGRDAPNDYSYGRDPLDYQWANDFGIDSFGDGGGVYFGSIASIPRLYDSGLPGNYGADWSYWRQNVWDFLCAGGNNFQTALNRSYDIQSFTSQPAPPDAMVWTGYGVFAF